MDFEFDDPWLNKQQDLYSSYFSHLIQEPLFEQPKQEPVVEEPKDCSVVVVLDDDEPSSVVSQSSSDEEYLPKPKKKRQSPGKWYKHLDEKLRELREQGLSFEKIGEILNKSPRTCTERWNLMFSPKIFKKDQQIDVMKLIETLRVKGRQFKEVASEFGVTVYAVRKIFFRYVRA